MNEPKILKEGESTFRNGGGGMCGGVVSENTFNSDPMAYMMAYYMKDEDFDVYKNIKGEKDRRQFFKKNAHSAI